MIAATPPDDVDLVVTVSPVLVAVVGATLLLWITVLTVFVLLRCREPWRDDGRPVFKRLPNGRIRFSWGVAHAAGCGAAHHRGRRAVTPSLDPS